MIVLMLEFPLLFSDSEAEDSVSVKWRTGEDGSEAEDSDSVKLRTGEDDPDELEDPIKEGRLLNDEFRSCVS